ncbi:MAG: tRNA 2-selenouridine(34) synthase MnmH [Deltaproteobacteria bacterium]|nr:tRNA 2-selenouridine(34) synthase MnmH [Deltaproteobacteria bacterium]
MSTFADNVMSEAGLAQLLLTRRPLIDVRSEIEFSKGAILHSINLPILNTEERDMVGKQYNQKGEAAAIRLGLKLVSGSVKKERIASWVYFIKHVGAVALFCWRGGRRSEIAQQWLKEHGIEIPRVKGGYKAIRNRLLLSLEQAYQDLPLIVLSGRTGVGKTALIKTLRHVDLEKIARHRGSAFGSMQEPQPRSATFENELALALLILGTGCQDPVIVEDESRLIGAVSLPSNFFNKMSASPLCVLEDSMENRIDRVFHEYVQAPLHQSVLSEPKALDSLKDVYLANVDRIKKKLGSERASDIKKIVDSSFERHKEKNDVSEHRIWIKQLLTDYYDPLYDYHIKLQSHRVVFRGDKKEVREYLAV